MRQSCAVSRSRVFSTALDCTRLRRIGAKGEGKFERIPWAEAIDTIASRLKKRRRTNGAANPSCRIATPGRWACSTVPAWTDGSSTGLALTPRPHHLFGGGRGRHTGKRRRPVRNGTGAVSAFETDHCLGGEHPRDERPPWPFIVEARRNRAKFYVIDPVVNRTGKLADKVFPIHPGSDLALALGLMHVLIRDGLCDREFVEKSTIGFDSLKERVQSYTPERVAGLTGIPAEDIISLAREYATVRPAGIRLNYGVQRSERGGSAVQAIALLPVLTGGYREVGGGLQLSTSEAYHFDRRALERPDLQPKPARMLNMSQLDTALSDVDDPPVKALVVYNSNPAAIAPNQRRVLKGWDEKICSPSFWSNFKRIQRITLTSCCL